MTQVNKSLDQIAIKMELFRSIHPQAHFLVTIISIIFLFRMIITIRTEFSIIKTAHLIDEPGIWKMKTGIILLAVRN